jgi:hypothetical protein
MEQSKCNGYGDEEDIHGMAANEPDALHTLGQEVPNHSNNPSRGPSFRSPGRGSFVIGKEEEWIRNEAK